MAGPLPPRTGAVVGAVLAVSLVAGVLHYGDAPAVPVFVVSAAALAGLAWIVSFATERVGERFGPALTGVLQSTLGNLPELFIVLFALRAGEVVVAQTSILGSLFANALLVLGLVVVAGSARADDGVMRFQRRLPNDTATLLLLASFIIVLLALSNSVSDRASQHQVEISAVGAVLLLLLYAFWLWGYLRAPDAAPAEPARDAEVTLPVAVVLLAVAGVLAALVSDWFVSAIDPAVRELGISKTFTGIVIVAIAGNAVENVAGIVLATKGKSDLAISVVKNSVAQIAAFLFPALVLLSLPFEHRLTFVIPTVFVGALVLMAIAVWQITGDGEAAAFEGWALVALFLIVAIVAWFEV